MSSDEREISSDENDLEIVEEPAETEELVTTSNEANENQEGEVASADDPNKKEPKVKRVRNPQPKLNAERLRGPRGLVILEDIFKKVKFRGPKHEETDLNLLMRTYEYWCHRLFPKFPFDASLERLEKLGITKEVQAYIKKIRMNLVDEDKPIIDSSDEEANEDAMSNKVNSTEHDEFDSLLSLPLPQSNVDSGELTEEQLERIRRNRQRAQQRRKQTANSQVSQERNALDIPVEKAVYISNSAMDLNVEISENGLGNFHTTSTPSVTHPYTKQNSSNTASDLLSYTENLESHDGSYINKRSEYVNNRQLISQDTSQLSIVYNDTTSPKSQTAATCESIDSEMPMEVYSVPSSLNLQNENDSYHGQVSENIANTHFTESNLGVMNSRISTSCSNDSNCIIDSQNGSQDINSQSIPLENFTNQSLAVLNQGESNHRTILSIRFDSLNEDNINSVREENFLTEFDPVE